MSLPSQLPPFRLGDAFAIAYVRGRNREPASDAFLVLSILRWDRRAAFAFQVVKVDGSLLEFRKMAMRGVSVEHALIHALYLFDAPLAQWRPFSDYERHLTDLESAKLLRKYFRARRDLLATLHRARVDIYRGSNRPYVKFAVRSRSDVEIRDDDSEKRLILSAVDTRGPVDRPG